MAAMKGDPNASLRAIPSVEALLHHPTLEETRSGIGHPALVRLVREILDSVRNDLREGRPAAVNEADLADRIRLEARALLEAGPVRVINATGVILHTNLGRSPLSPRAVEAVARVASG